MLMPRRDLVQGQRQGQAENKRRRSEEESGQGQENEEVSRKGEDAGEEGGELR